ncbi:hypothetical protein AK812_SmicGene31752 [Symbiodinium microadriaticum]|uniref:Uncharacterized protein n=1 Tax=Symbiodinium microadriaticum TaxID=2951 RepID=A0A1Q9CVZ9_SYMMI|nr:hypothetical protein AK812_SmicGene31752 [Symbiodinium microadriaticum]
MFFTPLGIRSGLMRLATVSTEDAESVDSSSDGSDEPLDVLGMEEDFAEASDDEDAGQDEKQAEEGRMEEYFSELDEQLESALDGELAGQEAARTDDALPLSSRHIKAVKFHMTFHMVLCQKTGARVLLLRAST